MCCYITPAGVQERSGTMATGALMVGFGSAVRGRERKLFQLFNEAFQYYTQLQQQGTIESFEIVVLEPYGGDLAGFTLIRGDREKLNALRTDEEFMRRYSRTGMVADNVRVINAFIGEELQRLSADYPSWVNDLL